MKADLLGVDACGTSINEFIAQNPGIKILSKHVVPEDKEGPTMLLIFYETTEDDQLFKEQCLKDQGTQLKQLIEIARKVAKDESYTALKNPTQREIFLFTRYSVPKCDAGIVVELLKPEMASVLGGA